MKSDGRPSLYAKQQLTEILLEYQKNHPNEKIKYSKLEKETGIKVHIWKYQMKDIIEASNHQNEKAVIPEQTGMILPSVDDIIKNCNNNPEELKNYLIVITNMVYDLYQYKEHKNTLENMSNEYDEKIRMLELQLEEQKKINTNQQNLINQYILFSSSKKKREDNGIKNNIIEFNRDNFKQYDNMFHDLIK